MKGWWFSSLGSCIMFYQRYIPEGQFQWFTDVVSYLQLIIDEIIDMVMSQISDIREAKI